MSVMDGTLGRDCDNLVGRGEALHKRMIAAKQWQAVAAYEGISQCDAKAKYSGTKVKKAEPCEEAEKATLGAARVLRPRVKPTRLEDDAQWMRTTKERIAALGMTAQEVSRYLGFDKSHITTMMSVVGSRGPISTGRVDRALTALERQRTAA